MSSLALPFHILSTALDGYGLAGAGSQLAFDAVTVAEHSELGTLTAVVTIAADGEAAVSTGNFPPSFLVLSGPCTTARIDEQFCVGRWPEGYNPNEDCTIAVVGGGVAGGGVLGACPVFDINGIGTTGDYLTFPDGSTNSDNCARGLPDCADCPTGTVLVAGQNLAWHSNQNGQGGNGGDHGNGRPYTFGPARPPNFPHADGPGGGWQICFGDCQMPFVGMGHLVLAGDTCPDVGCSLTVGSGTSLSLNGCNIPAEV